MGSFREWLSDHLRYVLLGLAIILILAVAVFAVKVIGGIGSKTNTPKTTETVSQTKQDVIVETNAQTNKQTEKQSNNLVKNDPKILQFEQAYYAAWINKDVAALQKMIPSASASDLQNKVNKDQIESIDNIVSYSKNGPTTGTYVVYASYDCKIVNIDTPVPSLAPGQYISTDSQGNLYIGDADSDNNVKTYMQNIQKDSDVQALVNEVTQKFNDAKKSDENLARYLLDDGTTTIENTTSKSNDTGTQANKVVTANTVCNVRADSSEDSDILGELNEGETVTRVKKLDNGWSEIRYGTSEGYVLSEYLSD